MTSNPVVYDNSYTFTIFRVVMFKQWLTLIKIYIIIILMQIKVINFYVYSLCYIRSCDRCFTVHTILEVQYDDFRIKIYYLLNTRLLRVRAFFREYTTIFLQKTFSYLIRELNKASFSIRKDWYFLWKILWQIATLLIKKKNGIK